MSDNAREATHAAIGARMFSLRDAIDDLIAIRVREHGDLLNDDEGELMMMKNSLDFLLSDIRESRIQKARKQLAVVR